MRNIKVKIDFTKENQMRYISHLDLMRLFQRAIRRASLPFLVTQGFNRHIKVSMERALKLGQESKSEKAYFSLKEHVGPSSIVEKLNKELPQGIRILNAEIN